MVCPCCLKSALSSPKRQRSRTKLQAAYREKGRQEIVLEVPSWGASGQALALLRWFNTPGIPVLAVVMRAVILIALFLGIAPAMAQDTGLIGDEDPG